MKLLFGTHHGRFLVLVAIAAAVLGTVARAEVLSLFGWAAIPLFLWAALVLYLLLGRIPVLRSRWREVIALLVLAIAITGALGILNGPDDTALGGRAGEIVAVEPASWGTRVNVSGFQYAQAWSRVAAILVLAAVVMAPSIAIATVLTAARGTWRGTRRGYACAQSAWIRFDEWQAERSERKRLESEARAEARSSAEEAEAAASAETEAKLMASRQKQAARPAPPLASSPREPFVNTGVAGEDETAGLTDDEIRAQALATEMTSRESAQSAIATGQGETGEDSAPSGIMTSEILRFNWQLPPVEMLAAAPGGAVGQAEIEATSQLIVDSLAEYGIDVTVDQVRSGPTVTMYGLRPGWTGSVDDPGKRVRVDTILNREKDLALALASPALRFEAPVPGESVVGIEVPNAHPAHVTLRSVMETEEFKRFNADAQLPVPLGLGTGGEPIFADLSRMPHTLVAGATGSGKSVCMNTIITGLLMARNPFEVRMVMIDPKRVELTPYAGIPHLYTPPVVEADRAVVILKSLVQEMMDRFRTLEQAGAKNIISYNQKASAKMPYLVILVDELADLMLTGAHEVERLLVRLAQLGRATGVHLVVATQRPSVDVVTGLIKANFPSRISFAVMSQIDSRTILDSTGAEKLLGKGDMLFLPVDRPKPQRVQGAFLSDNEVESVVDAWRNAGGPIMPQLDVKFDDEGGDNYTDDHVSGGDSLFDKAVSLAHTQRTLSTSLLQRRLRIGYPRAARLMDELEDQGVVGPGEPGKPRQVI